MNELTLDPDDWSELTTLGHRMLDDSLQQLATVRERPLWQPMPPDVRAYFAPGAPPREGRPLDEVYADFQRFVQPYVLGNVHPRFWGWVIGASSPAGVLAELLAAGLNVNVFGANESGAALEAQVISWLTNAFGLPAEATGLFVSSGSMANVVALTVARDARAGFDVVEEGLAGQTPLVVYCSRETHNSVDKAAGMLGIGRKQLRKIPTDAEYRIDLEALRRAIAEDRAAGRKPFCVVANCGTVNTGAIDDLGAIRGIADEEKLWMHVDGAIGAVLRLSPRLAPLTAGLESADSIAFDLHKWMNMPYDVAGVVVRSRETQSRSFSPAASYLTTFEDGIAAGRHIPSRLGPDLSRGFRALKVWMTIQTYGLDRFAAIIEKNMEQARYAGEIIEREPKLELLAPAPTNVICFRYRRDGLGDEQLDALNHRVLIEVQKAGIAAPSSTVLQGRYALRIAIVNQRTLREDVELALSEIVRIGDGL